VSVIPLVFLTGDAYSVHPERKLVYLRLLRGGESRPLFFVNTCYNSLSLTATWCG
jgi:hypothetical protein